MKISFRKAAVMLITAMLALGLAAGITACKPEPDEPELTKIEVTATPSKTEYFVDDTFDATGLKVTAVYSDGTKEDVTKDANLSGFDSSEAADSQKITVKYEGKTATFTVKIKAIELTGITVTTKPTKTEYFVGEELNLAGIKVTATYNNGKTKDVTDDVEASGFNSSAAAESKTVTVTYGGKTATFTVTIKDMKKMTVNEFITALGTAVETITYDTTKPAGVTLSTDEKTANVYNVKLSGEFKNSTGYKFPTTLVTADLTGLDTSGVTSMYYMFANCTELTSLDVSKLDTSNVTNMGSMFNYCPSLTSLVVSSFDTSNVTNMNCMFYNCHLLTSLDVSRFKTSKVKNMGSMFAFCEKVTSLDLSGFDTSNVTNMCFMFRYCYALTSLDLSKFKTPKVTTMECMFQGCKKLESLDVSSFDTSAVTAKDSMFKSCGTAETPLAVTVDGTKWTLGKDKTLLGATNLKFTDITHLVHSGDFVSDNNKTDILSGTKTRTCPECGETETVIDEQAIVYKEMTVNEFITALGTSVETITAKGVRESGVTLSTDGKTANVYGVKLTGAFSYSTGYKFPTTLVTADLRGLDTSSVTKMNHMFRECKSLTSLEVSSFDTSSVMDMNCMFYQCPKLTSLDLSSFDTSMVTNMSYMFYYCPSLTSLDLSSFDTSMVTDMKWMFYRCTSLTSLDVSSFDASSVMDMRYMFYYCPSLTSLDVSNFDTSSVTYMDGMFSECSKLTSLDLSKFDTSKVTSMSYMFSYCKSLTSLDVSSFDTSSVTYMDSMFKSCGTSETPLAVTYGPDWTLGTEATLLGATNLSFTLKQ